MLVNLLFKMALKCIAEVLSEVSKCNKSMMCPMKKIWVGGKVEISFVQTWLVVLLAGSSMFMNQQYAVISLYPQKIGSKTSIFMKLL